MNPTAEQIQKINHFSKVPIELCAKIANAVNIEECGPQERLLKEGDTGDTMVLVFQGQVEVTKNMMVKTPSGIATSKKPIVTYFIIGLCVIIFLIQFTSQSYKTGELFYSYGLIPSILMGHNNLPIDLYVTPYFFHILLDMYVERLLYH